MSTFREVRSKALDRKQLIMEKAIELFAARGFESTSVQLITEHCGISKGAFYLSFKSKDELILEIIDYFMKRFTTGVDRVVREKIDPKQKLFNLFYYLFGEFQRHSDLAKMFVRDQLHSLNEELLIKIYRYDQLMNQSILQLLEECYGSKIQHTKYELLFNIKGLMDNYSHIIFTYQMPIDVRLLSDVLVEKTNILANYSQKVLINEIMFTNMMEKMKFHPQNVEEFIEIEIKHLLNSLTDTLELESVEILQNELKKSNPSHAIILGMLENMKKNNQCHWLIYLVNLKLCPNK
jgi:AcrR family transcriptional regulator